MKHLLGLVSDESVAADGHRVVCGSPRQACIGGTGEILGMLHAISTRSLPPMQLHFSTFEVVDSLGDAPDIHVLPVGNAGNISAYWKGYKEYAAPYESATAGTLPAVSTKTPAMWGFQAAGAAYSL